MCSEMRSEMCKFGNSLYHKHFRVLKNVVACCGLKIVIYGKRNISKILKISLKRNDFVILKAINNPFYGCSFFTCFENSFFEQAK